MKQTSESSSKSTDSAKASSNAICLKIRGLGAISSFKNSKVLICRGPSGQPLKRPLLVTKKEFKKQMAAITESFVLQLCSEYRIRRDAMETGLSLPLWIACQWPSDDSLNQIPEIHVYVERVEKGQEGADVIIEPLA